MLPPLRKRRRIWSRTSEGPEKSLNNKFQWFKGSEYSGSQRDSQSKINIRSMKLSPEFIVVMSKYMSSVVTIRNELHWSDKSWLKLHVRHIRHVYGRSNETRVRDPDARIGTPEKNERHSTTVPSRCSRQRFSCTALHGTRGSRSTDPGTLTRGVREAAPSYQIAAGVTKIL